MNPASLISLSLFQISLLLLSAVFIVEADNGNGKSQGNGKGKEKEKEKEKKEKIKNCPADEQKPWSYSGNNGPKYWGDTYPDCSGSNQSPIQIDSSAVETDQNLGKLHFYNYDIPLSNIVIENNGYTVRFPVEDDKCRIIIINDRTYKLQEVHFHWGKDNRKGAEHIIDKTVYQMEMHLVHRSEQDDIGVVAVFLQQVEESNEDLQPLVDALAGILYKDSTAELNSSLSLNKLLPENPVTRYYRYEGSLTTPDCREIVTWSVVLDPITIGNDQIKYFRQLFSTTEEDAHKKCKISNNYRPVQPLNDRKVYSPE